MSDQTENAEQSEPAEAQTSGESEEENDVPLDLGTLQTVLTRMGEVLKEQRIELTELEAIQDNGETLAEQEAAASRSEVNYEAEMAIEAKGIAEQLAKEHGMPVKLVLHKTDGTTQEVFADTPLPTLESLRLMVASVAESFLHNEAEYASRRGKIREANPVRALLSYVGKGSSDALRAYLIEHDSQGKVKAQLSDEEVRDLMAWHFQSQGLVAVGLGIWVGAMLTRTGLTMEEVVECACDPVFTLKVQGLRTTSMSLNKLALEVLADVHKAEQKKRRKTAD